MNKIVEKRRNMIYLYNHKSGSLSAAFIFSMFSVGILLQKNKHRYKTDTCLYNERRLRIVRPS